MKRITFLFVTVATATGVIAWMAPSSLAQDNKGQVIKTQTGTKEVKQIIVTTIPRGYRDWKFISAAHEAGKLNDIRVAIGNDKAIKAYRADKPFPEGTIIGRVAWKMVSSEENNKTFGQAQSFVFGDAPDWYLQFMEKNTKKYAATGGWQSGPKRTLAGHCGSHGRVRLRQRRDRNGDARGLVRFGIERGQMFNRLHAQVQRDRGVTTEVLPRLQWSVGLC
jgi:hypothetical protein